jgi:hypothetical protein
MLKNIFLNYNGTYATVVGKTAETLPLVLSDSKLLNLHETIRTWSTKKNLSVSDGQIDDVISYFYTQTELANKILIHLQTMMQVSDGSPTAFDEGLEKMEKKFLLFTQEQRFYCFVAFVLFLQVSAH